MQVVIWSIDKYKEVGPIFWHFYEKYWTNNEFCSIIVTESHHYKQIPCKHIKVPGRTMNFGGRMRNFLREYQDETLMLLMIDYVMKAPLEYDVFRTATRLINRPDVVHVRLRPMPHPQLPWPDRMFGEIRRASRYSLSLQPGIWETKTLFNLMRDGDNPWHTETHGSSRTGRVRGHMLSSNIPVYSHHNYFYKGKVLPRTKQWIEDNW